MDSRMRMGVVSVAFAFGLMGHVGAGQQRPENEPARPNFDIRSSRAPATPSARAAAEIAGRRSGGRQAAVARLHPHTGALRVLDSPGVSISQNASATELLTAVRDLAPRLGLDDDDLNGVELVRDYASASTRLRHVTFAQQLDGLPVFGAVVTLHISSDGSIVRVNSSAARGGGRRRGAAVAADAAVVAAVADVSPNAPFAPVRLDPGSASTARFARGRFSRDITSSLEWFPMDGSVRLAWHVELETVPLSQFYDLLIDATSGELLLRRNRVLDANGSGRVNQSNATQAIDPRRPDPSPTSGGACPPPSNYELRDLTAPFRDSTSVLADSGRLSGNNAHVFRGTPGNEGALGTFDGTRWVFDAPFGSAASAETALFFSLNFLHDFFYDLGFDEAAGNFQVDNFGRGGTGGDALSGLARAAGRNNASFQPEPEGTSPVMSMFLFDGTGCWAQDVDGDGSADLDGDYDTDIIFHEFHHGVSHRLNTQFTGEEAGAIGEGGSDFFAYSINGDTFLGEYSYPGGIRSINAKTYANWFCLFGFFCEVHWNGEIWANVLWETRERFRTDLVGGSESAAINEVHQLYVDGLKLSPPAPTMLDMRDAMLLADAQRNPGSPNSQNYCRLWESFAARGMGVNATDTSANPNYQVSASAAVPAGCNAPPSSQVVSITATTATATEAGLVSGAFTVRRAEPLSSPLNVNLGVTGSATAGADYVAVPAFVTIPANAVSVVVPIVPLDDTTVESNESVMVAIAAGGYTIGSPSSATVTVVSDDLAPDFIISSFSAPDIASAGQSITVTDTTRNQGGGQGAASTTSFYLSPNSLWDATDIPLATRDVPALGPGATHTANTTLTIPEGTGAAVWYVIAKADGPGVLTESSELNNFRSESISIGADLVVSAMTVPLTGGAGVQIAVPNTVRNQGTGASAPSTARFYLSVNFMIDAGDQMLAGRPVPALNPGDSNAATTNVTIPSTWPTGTYYVLAVADADNEVPETSNTNNTRSASIRIGPDLSVTALNVPVRAAVGASISIGDTTSNSGGGPAGASSRTALYLSPNTTWEASDIPLGMPRDIPALGAGAVSSGTTPVTLPASAGPGRWYVIARADDLAQVTETLETNNVRYGSIDVGPDLTLQSVSAVNSVAAGASLTVTDTVLNYGIQTAPASTNRYYLSLNATLDAGDIPLSGQRDVPALGQNGSSTGSITLQIPTGLSGTYYFFAVADGNGVISEASETNNSRWRLLTITP
jgi:subtilase family serine protease